MLELVRYIHLNAIRAGLVKEMEGLDRYRWSGHSVLMGRESRPWQAREEVLSYFGAREGFAQRRYRQFVFEAIGLGKRGELSTGRESRGGGRVGEEGSGKGEFPSGNSHYYGSAFSGSALCGLHSTPPLGVIKRTASCLSR